MTYGSKRREPHGLGAVAVVRRAARRRRARKFLGFWTRTSPTSPRTIPTIPATSTGGSGDRLRHQRRVPLRRRAASRAARPSRPTSRTMPRGSSAQHDIKFGVQYTKGRGNSPGRLLPELRQLPLPATAGPRTSPYLQDRLRRQRAPLLQLQGHDQPLPDGAHRRLHGAFFDDQWSLDQAAHDQPRAALRPHDHQVRRRGRSTTSRPPPTRSTTRPRSCATAPRPATSSISRRGRPASG